MIVVVVVCGHGRNLRDWEGFAYVERRRLDRPWLMGGHGRSSTPPISWSTAA
jgi:hypothetical protein